MKTVELTKGVYWVGAIDWNVRDFHGYSTPSEPHIILSHCGRKNRLGRHSKAQFFPEMLGRSPRSSILLD